MTLKTADTRLHDLCVFILRARPFHNAHLKIIREALARAEVVVLLIGSAFAARSERNPFTHQEVIDMIRASLTPEELSRVRFEPIIDTLYTLTGWQESVQQAVARHAGGSDRIALIGHHKDQGTSFYLKLFPQWKSEAVDNFHNNLSATDIRNTLFDGAGRQPDWANVETYVPVGTLEFLKGFTTTSEFKELNKEIAYYRAYRLAHERATDLIAGELGYRAEIKHHTVDAMVVQSGNVLLIRRKNFPGRNLLALPGGFVDNDTLAEAVIRELKEETRLKVPVPVLWGNHIYDRPFDDPHRSSRGRVITHAYLFHLPPAMEFPSVKPRTDAKEAFWAPIGSLRPEEFFEDHYQIIQNLKGYLDKATVRV